MIELPVLPLLKNSKILLRPFVDTDLDLVEEASSSGVIPLITTVPVSFTSGEGMAFIQRQINRYQSGAGYSLVIENLVDGRPAGQIGLWPDKNSGRATLGYWVVRSQQGNRLASEALSLLSDWAFQNLDLHRLTLYIEPRNVSSAKTARFAGFESEGILKDWERVGKEVEDMEVYTLLAPPNRL